MDIPTYYAAHKFALWVDLRSTEDNFHGTGKAQDAKKNSIMMEITKNDHGVNKCIMDIFVVSDARIIIQNKLLSKFEY
jgi:hypothetical protein